MARTTTDYRETLLQSLRDPKEAQFYLNAAREEAPDAYQRAISDVIAARRAEFEAAHPKRERVPLDPPPNYNAEYFAAMEIMDSEAAEEG